MKGMYLGADAGAKASNLTLLVAILGIFGTLTATFVTQWLSGKRDDKQWQRQKELQDDRFDREREQEATRWEREREERLQQWRREDEAKLHNHRLSAYAELRKSTRILSQFAVLGVILTRTGRFENMPTREDHEEKLARFARDWKTRAEDLHSAVGAVELISSTAIRKTVREFQEIVYQCSSAMSPQGISKALNFAVVDMQLTELASELLTDMRRELGSE